MKKVTLIRHAESIANAGQATDSHDMIPLSEKGRLQAQELAETLTIKPDLIVISPFSRTHETAQPFIAKHPNVPVETWDVHEFTYLDPKKFKETKAKERFPAALLYWTTASVHHRDGDAESFSDLTNRMASFIEKLKSRPENTIVVFTHGRFIYGLKLYLEKTKKLGRIKLTDRELTHLKNGHTKIINYIIAGKMKFPIDNVSIHEIEI